MAQDNEASVEEILESIKKVIARDNREDALEARRRRVEEADQAEAAVAPKPTDGQEAGQVLDLAEMEFVEDHDVALKVCEDTYFIKYVEFLHFIVLIFYVLIDL